jgi:heat shock protein HtpX
MANQFKTAMLLTIMTVFIMMAGRFLGGTHGMVVALFIAGAMNFFSYWFSDKMVLRMYRAEEVSPSQAPEIYSIVEELAQTAGLPMPRVYIIPQESPNAFATGRNPENAVVAVTHGLLKLMGREEIKGVLAHEMGHIKNRDILIGTIAATMAGAVMMLAQMARWTAMFGGYRGNDGEGEGGGIIGLIVMSVIAPLAAAVIQMAISRSREYLADATAARLTGNPEGLAGALEKLGMYSGRIPMQAEPATAHMFITNPLSGRSFVNLFSTHPPIEDRVARLRNERPRTMSGGNPSGERHPERDARNFWDSIR